MLDNGLEQQKQQGRTDEAHEWGEEQRIAYFGGLTPVDTARAVAAVHQGVRDADADDRADEGMRGGGRQPQVPGAEIPENRGDQQGEYHGEPGTAADLQNQLDRQQGDDAEGDRSA